VLQPETGPKKQQVLVALSNRLLLQQSHSDYQINSTASAPPYTCLNR